MIVLTEHAAWRQAERSGASVRLEEVAAAIGAALSAGWFSRTNRGDLLVATRDGHRFVARELDGLVLVITALGRGHRAGGSGEGRRAT